MYNIGRLAALAGCKPVTVRYYERKGLLKSPRRQENGYRWYSEEDLENLAFIRHCRSHGFSLEEIRDLLDMKAAPEASCGRVDEIVSAHIEKLDGLLESLRGLRDQLSDLKGRCPHAVKVSECGIMRGLLDRSQCPCGEPDEGRGRGQGHVHGHGNGHVHGHVDERGHVHGHVDERGHVHGHVNERGNEQGRGHLHSHFHGNGAGSRGLEARDPLSSLDSLLPPPDGDGSPASAGKGGGRAAPQDAAGKGGGRAAPQDAAGKGGGPGTREAGAAASPRRPGGGRG